MARLSLAMAASALTVCGFNCQLALAIGLTLGESEEADSEMAIETPESSGAKLPVSKEEVFQALNDMRNAPSDPHVAEASCNIIHGRGYTDPDKDWFYDANGLEPPLEALDSFPGAQGVQLACAHALASMSRHNRRTMTAAGEAGVVELVLKIMRRWPDDRKAQIGDVSACFMDYSADNRARWADAGGIDLTMKSIKTFFAEGETVLPGWYALSSGIQMPNTDGFVRAGGIELALVSMKYHGKNYRVREEVMKTMRHLGTHSDLAKLAVDKGWLEAVVEAMKDAPMDLHQQAIGCTNLAVYSGRNSTFRARVVELGSADLALDAVRAFPRMMSLSTSPASFEAQNTVREDCVDLLAQLSLNEEGRRQLQEAQVTNEMTMLLWTHPLNSRLQSSGGVLLQKLKS